jgi:hypothetical protein
MLKELNVKLDGNYHVAFLDPKTKKIIDKEKLFQTLEEVLGYLHKFEESEKIRERMLACLMSLRDGVSEVTVYRKEFHTGHQILRITPTEEFCKLFWLGAEL